jgi:phosphatidylserine/phosphatidylglycerophosphate/cardiolipin synthase-like enzyme
MEEMEEYMNSGFRDSQVRLAHELGNLTDKKVVTDVQSNQARNPNSIMTILDQIGDQMPDIRSIRIVSPYLFLAEYKNKDGELVNDEAEGFRRWLEEHPDATLEIITNSVLTSDNFPAQSVIDMETAPRLYLPPQIREEWLSLKGKEEAGSELVNSEKWLELVGHPRLKVYETGRLDSVLLGGDKSYGKLHAKFFISGDLGFIGTTNFDYRSRLYNNEMGFFFLDPELARDVHESFDELIGISYLWGSPEWLQLRKAVMEKGGMKGRSTQRQRGWYKLFKNTGIIWLL